MLKRHVTRLAWLGFLSLLASSVLGDTRAASAPGITETIDLYNTLAEVPLQKPSRDALHRLRTGAVVRMVSDLSLSSGSGRAKQPVKHRIVAFCVIEEPRPLVWLAVRDRHFHDARRLTAFLLTKDRGGRKLQYQHLKLPWPIRDRHWVVESRPGVELEEATKGLIWELSWKLVDDGEQKARALLESGRVPGLDARTARRAVYLPENSGAWTLFALDDRRTLLAYQLNLIAGGRIAETWGRSFSWREVPKLLRGVARNSARAEAHYNQEHERIVGGDGLLIQ